MDETAIPVQELINHRQWEALSARLRGLHPSDVADLIALGSTAEEAVVFRLLPKEKAATVFSYLPPERQRELIKSLSRDQVHRILDDMTPDDRTRFLEEVPAEVTRELLLGLAPQELAAARKLLGYPERTAGRYMTPEYAWIYADMTAARAIQKIREAGRGKETLNWVYVIDNNGKLVEDVRLANLVLADPDTNVLRIEDPELVSVRAVDNAEEVLKQFRKYDRTALPVTDEQGFMLGIITVDDVLDIAEREATEDIQKLGGSEALDAPYLDVAFWSMVRKRAGWLSALFVGDVDRHRHGLL